MADKNDLTPPSADVTPIGDAKKKKAKAPKEKKEGNPGARSRFNSLYPEDATIKVLVEKNPKKEGSKSRERFEHYFKAKTVGDFLKAGGLYADIAYDVGHGHIQVTKAS